MTGSSSTPALLVRLTAACALAGYLVMAAGGCSKYASLEGKVTLDGKPLPGATIVFIPEEASRSRDAPRTSHAMTARNGRFRLITHNGFGGVPGRYKVTISRQVVKAGAAPAKPDNPIEMMQGGPAVEETVPRLYTDPLQTPLRVEIPSGGKKDLLIELNSERK